MLARARLGVLSLGPVVRARSAASLCCRRALVTVESGPTVVQQAKRKLTVGDLVQPLGGLQLREHFKGNNKPPPIVDADDAAENFVMDNPVSTLGRVEKDGRVVKSDALGLDVKKMCNDIKRVCEMEPGPRSKSLLAIMRGVGGGKTRVFTEVWLEILTNHRHLLPLLVTFNNKTELDHPERSLFNGVADGETRVCLAVAFRMLHALFDIKFADLLTLLKPVVEYCVAHRAMLGELLAYACERVNQERGDGTTQVTHAVLLVDEAVELAERLHDEEAVGQILRHGVLDLRTDFHLALAVSSLSTSLVSFTGSGRAVLPLHVPEALDPKDIVERWWRLDPNSLELQWLAAAVCASPRATQYALIALKRVLVPVSGKEGQYQPLGLEDLKRVWTEVEAAIRDRYPGVKVPIELWCKAVFGEEVGLLGADAKEMLRRSVFVNAPKLFDEHDTYVPKMSAAMLYRMEFADAGLTRLVQGLTQRIFALLEEPKEAPKEEAKEAPREEPTTLMPGPTTPVQRTVAPFKTKPATPQAVVARKLKEGTVLESFLREWLQILVLSAVLRPAPPLRALLGIDASRRISKMVPHLELAVVGSLACAENPSDVVQGLNSNAGKHREEFVTKLCETVVDGPVVLATHPEDAFDAIVAVRAGKDEEVHVILFECKAKEVTEFPPPLTVQPLGQGGEQEEPARRIAAQKKNEPAVKIANSNTIERQAENVHRLAQLCRKRGNLLPDNSVAEAMAAGRWTMVYIANDTSLLLRSVADYLKEKNKTKNKPMPGDGLGMLFTKYLKRSFGRLLGTDANALACAGWVVRLGEAERERFFGPLFPLYRSLRAAYDNKPEGHDSVPK